MVNKKLTIKRLVIFFILSVLPLIGISIGLSAAFGEPAFASKNPDVLKWVSFLSAMGMFAPAIAHVITRLVTKEGWEKTYLGFTAKKGNIRYFAFSVFFKPIESIVYLLVVWGFFLGEMSFSEVFNTEQPVAALSLVFMQLAASVVFFFPAFGEEWGWRGYMMPKLLELMPKPAAIVVGGIIWGLWHAPLTVIGHNFGVDYPGFPFVGIAIMCGVCIAENAVFTLLTERTKSIYPASFLHMINNNLSPLFMISVLFSPKAQALIAEKLTGLSPSLLYLGVLSITAAVCFVLFIRKKKQHDNQ